MVQYFNDVTNNADEGRKSSVRALQAWQILIGKAYNRQIVRYRELARIMDYPDERPLSTILGCIMYFCDQNDLPPLTILVVNQDGVPGGGFTAETLANYHRRREEVHNHKWYKIIPPTINEFQTAFDNR